MNGRWADALPKLAGHQPQERQHRTASYEKGCRCESCRQAARDRQRAYRARKKEAEQ